MSSINIYFKEKKKKKSNGQNGIEEKGEKIKGKDKRGCHHVKDASEWKRLGLYALL